MNESEYYADEFADAELHAMADAGELHLDKDGFVIQLSDAQLDRLADHGQRCTSGADCAECAAVYMRPNGTVYMVCLKEDKRVLQCRGDEEWVPKEAFE